MSDDGVAGKMFIVSNLSSIFGEGCLSNTFGLADLNKLTPPEIVKLVVIYRQRQTVEMPGIQRFS